MGVMEIIINGIRTNQEKVMVTENTHWHWMAAHYESVGRIWIYHRSANA